MSDVTKGRDARLQSFVLGGRDLGTKHGSGNSPTFQFGAEVEAVYAESATIFPEIANPDSQITIECYPEEPIDREMYRLLTRQRAAAGGAELPGSASDNNGRVWTWSDGRIMGEPELGLGRGARTHTWTVKITGVQSR